MPITSTTQIVRLRLVEIVVCFNKIYTTAPMAQAVAYSSPLLNKLGTALQKISAINPPNVAVTTPIIMEYKSFNPLRIDTSIPAAVNKPSPAASV